MERGPSRRVINGSGAAAGSSRAASESSRTAQQTPPAEEPRQAYYPQVPQPQAPKKGSLKWLIWLIVGIVVVGGILVGIWLAASSYKQSTTGIDQDKYQAVFLTSGQVYFGKLEIISDDYLQLTDVFYLQQEEATADDISQETAASGEVQMIKLGDELHGPEDQMVISRTQVLFYENLKDDGTVVQSITQYNSQN